MIKKTAYMAALGAFVFSMSLQASQERFQDIPVIELYDNNNKELKKDDIKETVVLKGNLIDQIEGILEDIGVSRKSISNTAKRHMEGVFINENVILRGEERDILSELFRTTPLKIGGRSEAVFYVIILRGSLYESLKHAADEMGYNISFNEKAEEKTKSLNVDQDTALRGKPVDIMKAATSHQSISFSINEEDQIKIRSVD